MTNNEGFKCKLENGDEIEYIPASESELGIPIIRLDTGNLRYESPAYYPVKNHKIKLPNNSLFSDKEKENFFKMKADYIDY